MTAYDLFMNSIDNILRDIKERSPLIHCITNPISINDCANAVLALGGRPIMAEHPLEVAEITRTAAALCLNIGNITDARMRSIHTAAAEADAHGIPVILDVVGITCSSLRYDYIKNLLADIKPAVIKGNLSEIKKLADSRCSFVGVDSTEVLDSDSAIDEAVSVVRALSAQSGCVIAASGSTDIISDGCRTALVDNGCEAMSRITGTGCLMNVTIGTFLASDSSDTFIRAVLGAAVLGICGELAQAYNDCTGLSSGLGTYHINLLNALSAISADDIKEKAEIRFF